MKINTRLYNFIDMLYYIIFVYNIIVSGMFDKRVNGK